MKKKNQNQNQNQNQNDNILEDIYKFKIKCDNENNTSQVIGEYKVCVDVQIYSIKNKKNFIKTLDK